jgi:hypothetical protein
MEIKRRRRRRRRKKRTNILTSAYITIEVEQSMRGFARRKKRQRERER